MIKCIVKGKKREDLERAVKKFKHMCEKEGVFTDLKKCQYFLKPSAQKRQARHKNKLKIKKTESRRIKRRESSNNDY